MAKQINEYQGILESGSGHDEDDDDDAAPKRELQAKLLMLMKAFTFETFETFETFSS